MKYTNEDINLENGIQKEWIITNGIGGICKFNNNRSKHQKVSWTTNSTINTTSKKILDIIKSR